jgi:hypothetical protein
MLGKQHFVNLRDLLRQTFVITASAVILTGCNENTSDSTELTDVTSSPSVEITKTIQEVEVENLLTKNKPISIQTHITLDKKLNNVPLTYYLISDDADQVVNDDDENNVTIDSTPKRQYNVGSRTLNLESGDSIIENNITINNDIPQGSYHLAAHFDPKNSYGYKEGNIYVGPEIIEVESATPDIILHSASLDEDILLVDNENSNLLVLSTLQAQSISGTIDNICQK